MEEATAQVEFILHHTQLPKNAKILDLACGYGRHALLFAQKGFQVTGVDITEAYIDDAQRTAKELGLSNAQFIRSDIRDVRFRTEFDLVLNLADGAIGYLENDRENEKIFDVIASALKPGGHHVMDIINGEYADRHFPMRNWEIGENTLALSEFEWDPKTRIMLFGGTDIPFGAPLPKSLVFEGDPTRLYTQAEIHRLWSTRGMCLECAYAGFSEAPASPDAIQMLLFSAKE